MSKSQPDRGDWSGGSESLFQASRADHDPSASDRARVRDALARRLAAGAAVSTNASGDAQSSAATSARGVTLGNIAKLSVAVALAVTGSFAVMRTLGHSSEQPQPMQPVAPAASSGTAPALRGGAWSPVPSSTESTREATPTADGRSPGVKIVRSGSRPLIHPAAHHLRTHAAPAKRATLSSNIAADSVVSLESGEPVPARSAIADSDAPARADSRAPTLAVASHDQLAEISRPASQEPVAHAAERSTAEAARLDESDDARAELALVERIHAAMRSGNPSVALALCAKHELGWPHGTFALEREGVRAIALCELRSKQAESRARTFLADHPSTPLAPRVAAACAAQLSAAGDAPKN